jgi:hypothetical protein
MEVGTVRKVRVAPISNAEQLVQAHRKAAGPDDDRHGKSSMWDVQPLQHDGAILVAVSDGNGLVPLNNKNHPLNASNTKWKKENSSLVVEGVWSTVLNVDPSSGRNRPSNDRAATDSESFKNYDRGSGKVGPGPGAAYRDNNVVNFRCFSVEESEI